MDTRLIWTIRVVILIVAALAYGRWFAKINSGTWFALKEIVRFFLDPKTCKVAETFFIEASVLWFVFPLLDTLYAHRHLTDHILLQANLAALIFFIAALTLSHVAKGD